MNQLRWKPWTDPHVWQPYPTVFQLADAAGVHTAQVSSPDFQHTPLTKIALSGGTFRGKLTGEDRMDLAAEQLAAGDRSLVYTYYSEVDGKGHRFGMDSDAWRGQLMYVDRLAQRLAEQLPPRAALYITADHGMIDIPFDEESRIDFDEDWELGAGVALLGGEGRARHVYAVPGAGNDVLTVWREVLGEQFWVASRDEAIAGRLVRPGGRRAGVRTHRRRRRRGPRRRRGHRVAPGAARVRDGGHARLHDARRAARPAPRSPLVTPALPRTDLKGPQPLMPELVFFSGTMDCGKSTLALQIEHNRSARGLQGMIFTRDDRAGVGKLSSRLGLVTDAVEAAEGFDFYAYLVAHLSQGNRADYVIVDEAQFLAGEQIDQLARVVDDLELDVFAFGITTDFRSKLFPGSQRLVELADRVEVLQVEALCWCGARATHNARTIGGEMVVEGAQVVVGDVNQSPDEVGYEVLCRRHHRRRMTAAAAHAAALSPDVLPVDPSLADFVSRPSSRS